MILRGPSRPDFLLDEVLADVFEATVSRQPERTALISGALRLSYRDLDARADLMAHHLIGKGVRPGHIVGLWVPRGIDLLVSQLAITKTGAAWLPFDADTPVERVAVCLEDAQAVGIVTGHGLHTLLHDSSVPVWDQADLLSKTHAPLLRRTGTSPDHPAYVIYTSGSTGKPKGIAVSQRSICHFLRSENAVLGVRATTVSTRASRSPSTCRSRRSGFPTWSARRCGSRPREIAGDPDALPRVLAEERSHRAARGAHAAGAVCAATCRGCG